MIGLGWKKTLNHNKSSTVVIQYFIVEDLDKVKRKVKFKEYTHEKTLGSGLFVCLFFVKRSLKISISVKLSASVMHKAEKRSNVKDK